MEQIVNANHKRNVVQFFILQENVVKDRPNGQNRHFLNGLARPICVIEERRRNIQAESEITAP
jgi:hypothetical protein